MKKVLAVLGATLLLTACDNCCEDKAATSGFDSINGEATPGSAAEFHQVVGDTVHFGFDKHDLTSEAQAVLGKQTDWLKKWPQTNVVVEGHCDIRGTTEYNMALGERRAHSVKKFLVGQGVDAKRVETVSYGKEHPVDQATTEEAHAKNRRSVTVLR
jgi:peptidoglycan-associated lipoprotein